MMIEKSIPVPRGFPRKKYPFGDMKINDSLLFEGATQDSKEVSAAKMFFKRRGWKLTTRTEKNGVRIWRIF